MLKKLSRLNQALPALWVSILFYGVLCQIIGIFLVKNKLSYSFGLWIGILLALLMAYHMAYVLERALDMGERGAQAVVMKHNLIRYAVIVIVLAIVMLTDVANPLAAFAGIMGLKVGAYLQPFANKLLDRQGKLDIENKTGD